MKFLTFGEIMRRQSFKDSSCEISYGGSEANVCVSLSILNTPCVYVTKLPDNRFGKEALDVLNNYNIDTSFIKLSGDNIGSYDVYQQTSDSPYKIIYNRKNSEFAKIDADEFDFGEIFKGVTHFHYTLITSALSENCKKALISAVKTAKKMGICVTCDINFRKELHSADEARKTAFELFQYTDHLIANIDEILAIFDFESEDNEYIAKKPYEYFPFKSVSVTYRKSLPDNKALWYGYMYIDKFYKSKEYIVSMDECMGAGDSFTAGIIYAIMNNLPTTDGLGFASACGAIKHKIKGDFNTASKDEISNFIK